MEELESKIKENSQNTEQRIKKTWDRRKGTRNLALELLVKKAEWVNVVLTQPHQNYN